MGYRRGEMGGALCFCRSPRRATGYPFGMTDSSVLNTDILEAKHSNATVVSRPAGGRSGRRQWTLDEDGVLPVVRRPAPSTPGGLGGRSVVDSRGRRRSAPFQPRGSRAPRRSTRGARGTVRESPGRAGSASTTCSSTRGNTCFRRVRSACAACGTGAFISRQDVSYDRPRARSDAGGNRARRGGGQPNRLGETGRSTWRFSTEVGRPPKLSAAQWNPCRTVPRRPRWK
jgi:hypothetical protein